MADGDVAPFVAHVDNPLIVATHHKPIGISRRNFIGRDPSVVVSHTYSLTMVAMEEVGNMTRLKNAAHYAPCIKIARDGTNREVWLHDLAEVISGGGEACEVPHRSCSSISSLDLSGDAALRYATLPATHRALPNWISVLALEPSHHGRLGGRMLWKNFLQTLLIIQTSSQPLLKQILLPGIARHTRSNTMVNTDRLTRTGTRSTAAQNPYL